MNLYHSRTIVGRAAIVAVVAGLFPLLSHGLTPSIPLA